MLLILPLIAKIIPLYCYILLGYLAGRHLEVKSDVIARLMFFMINPLIIFNGIATTRMGGNILSLPLLIFALSCLISVLFYRISRHIWSDSSKNLAAFSAGSGNTGYFGLSLALVLLNDQAEGVYIMAMVGVTLFENTIGYYISAKGAHPPLQCLKNLIKLPTTYALLLGLLFNFFSIHLPTVYTEFMGHIKSVYTVLGMMLVGIGVSAITSFKWDFKFIGITFLAKFFVWPLLILTTVAIDSSFFGVYDHDIHQALILLSIVPMAVNTIVMASLMKYQSDKAAFAVLLSTFFALFYVPLMTSLFID